MPYTLDDPPDAIKELPKAAQEVWIAVFNENADDEDAARMAAWGAVKQGWKKTEGKWVKKSDELLALLTKFFAEEEVEKEMGPDDLSRMVRDAFYAQHPRPKPAEIIQDDWWVNKIEADVVIVEGSDGLYSVPYTVMDDAVEFGEPVKVEVEYKPVEKAIEVTFAKADDEKRLVYGIVLEPDAVDTQGDVVSKEEIERACHEFMLRSQKNDLEHARIVWREEVAIVENYIAPGDMEFPGQTVKEGSWVMVTKVFSDSIWKAIKSEELTGYSIKGTGVRREVVNA
jgi:cation transport regulator ChaB